MGHKFHLLHLLHAMQLLNLVKIPFIVTGVLWSLKLKHYIIQIFKCCSKLKYLNNISLSQKVDILMFH